ncbi:methyl-accepting chemotaxis protein [Oceanospirillum sanctuarii]|uniref:methyl-accepting chemotaxis protein n=1 Tax=Oceanospirillum sanctuarii TaxID=1434821 RepID=UPI000A36DB4D|nr:methyl-accepting chemotaxis protein [Oceanospirillum sanctuarii]
MTIKQKLLLNTSAVAIAMVAMFSLLFWTTGQIEELGHGEALAMELQTDILEMRKDEKDFITRHNHKYVEHFDEKAAHLDQVVVQLKHLSDAYDLNITELDGFKQSFKNYQTRFHAVVKAKEEIGLDHNSGLRGQLRSSIHEAEKLLVADNDKDTLIDLLQLRRHEKDFMLRLDMKYAVKFDQGIADLKSDLEFSTTDSSVLKALMAYETQFRAYVAANQKLGLDSYSGLQSQMRESVHQVETLLGPTLEKIQTELDANLQHARMMGILLFISLMGIILLISYFIGRSVFLPIQKIQQDIRNIDTHRDLSLRVHHQGNDEISQMAQTLNVMLEGFQKVITQVNRAVIKMNERTEQLSANANSTSAELQRQLSETDQIAAAVTEMVSTIEEVARNTESMAENAQTTHNDALNSQKKVQVIINNIHSMSDRLEGSADSVNELSQQSQTIGNVLNVIQEIAEQTNLLALNAAIEAARAGEQGRGFAVVADEVRALAGRTSDATHEISGIIGSLQNKTDSIVSLITHSREEGINSREQAVFADEALRGITQDVTHISDRAAQIAAAIEEQSCVANEVGQNVINVRDITEAAAASVRHNAEASHEISEEADHLYQVVSEFKV